MSKSKTGIKQSPDTIEKRAKKHRGMHHSDEAKRNISESLIGRKLSEEHKKNMSLALKGRPARNKGVPGLRGKQHPMFGKHHTEEARKKISEATKGRPSNRKGQVGLRMEKHPNWHGGKKTANARQHARRKRELGFTPLNDCDIDGWIGHHMDKEYVMFVPENIHKNTPHRQSNPKSMDEINEKVIDWYVNYYGLI